MAVRELLATFDFGVDTSKLRQGQAALAAFAKATRDTAAAVRSLNTAQSRSDAGQRRNAKVGGGFGGLFGDIQGLGTALAGGYIAHQIKAFTSGVLEDMMMIRRGAAELRITTDEMQSLRSVGRALGVDVKWLHFSMERLQVSTELAARGSKRQATSMKMAGLETKKANGETKSATELFLDLASGLEKIKDPAKQAIVVWDLFGRGGHRLLPMLRVGRERLEELMMATKKYGQYSKETLEKAAKLTVQNEILNLSFRGLADSIGASLLPALEVSADWMGKVARWLALMTKRSQIGAAALTALSVVMGGLAIRFAILHPLATAVVGAFVALTLVLDDLMVFMRGGDSVLGRLIDMLYGKNAHVDVVLGIKEAWKGILDVMKDITGWFDSHPELLEGLRLLYLGAVKYNPIKMAGEVIGDTVGDELGKSHVERVMKETGTFNRRTVPDDFVGPTQQPITTRRVKSEDGGTVTYHISNNTVINAVPVEQAHIVKGHIDRAHQDQNQRAIAQRRRQKK